MTATIHTITPTDHDFARHLAGEVIHAAFASDCGHATATDTAQRIEELFEHCDRRDAAHALALALLPLLRPRLFEREG
jgi:hypothetical protein